MEQGEAGWAEGSSETEGHLGDQGTIANRPPHPRARALQPRHRQQVALVRFGQAREGRLLWKCRRLNGHQNSSAFIISFQINKLSLCNVLAY